MPDPRSSATGHNSNSPPPAPQRSLPWEPRLAAQHLTLGAAPGRGPAGHIWPARAESCSLFFSTGFCRTACLSHGRGARPARRPSGHQPLRYSRRHWPPLLLTHLLVPYLAVRSVGRGFGLPSAFLRRSVTARSLTPRSLARAFSYAKLTVVAACLHHSRSRPAMPTTVNEPSDSTTPPGFGRPPLPLPPPYPSTRPLSPAGIPASSSLRPPAPAGFAASAASDSSAARHASLSAHQWNEPPLAQPKASYREYDDKAFMNASTLHMQPLGEMPSAKMLEATKRPYPHQPKKQKGVKPAFFLNIQQSNGNGASKDASIISSPSGDAGGGGAGPGGGGEEGGEGGEGGGDSGAACIAGGDSVPGAVATPQESNVRTFTVPSAPPVRPSPNQPPSFAVMTPVTKPSTPTTAASPSASSRAAGSPTIAATGSSAAGPRHPPAAAGWMNGQTPSSKTEQGRARLSMVVDAAIQRSSLVGNVELGKAIKKLYDESLENNELADLLDAVLAQNARPDQIHQFQTYVRYARENPEQRVTGRDRPAALPATTRTAAPLSVSTPTRPTAMAPIKVEPTEQRQGLNGAVGVSQIERRVGSDATATYTELQPGEHHNGRMDSDSDMRSVSVETGNGPNSTPALGKRLSHQRQLERDLRDNDSEHPEKRAKTIVPEDASTRDPGSVQSRTRGRKRQRSPSMTSPVPPVESGPPSSTSSYAGQSVPQTLPPSQHPPKKKNKQSKFKISSVFPLRCGILSMCFSIAREHVAYLHERWAPGRSRKPLRSRTPSSRLVSAKLLIKGDSGMDLKKSRYVWSRSCPSARSGVLGSCH